MSEVDKIITETRAYSCLDCGKCTAACPVAHYDPGYSPRQLVNEALFNREDLLKNDKLWSCLTCSTCEQRCQSGVRYTELIKGLRTETYAVGKKGQCSHDEALQSLMRMMTADQLNQNRMSWVTKGMKITTEGDVLYFVGCQPYFDVIFKGLGVRTLDIARSAVKIFNQSGIVPAVLPDERCCGHDLVWSGDLENFVKLAKHNLRLIRQSKAKQVITTCPECYLTLKVEYPKYLGELGFEVVHMSRYMAQKINDNKLKFRHLNKKVTYQDSCRLGRFAGIYKEPRSIIEAIPGIEMVEMGRNKSNALCCGTQAWMNCGALNKRIQVDRLEEARSTGAGLLLTSCPKCQIHFKCAMNDKKIGQIIDINDITAFAASLLTSQEVSSNG